MFGVVAVWGLAFTAVKVLLEDLTPAGLAAGRTIVTWATFAALLPLAPRERRPPEPGDRVRLAIAGVTGIGAYNLSLAWGSQHVAAGVASVIVSTTPIVTAVLGAWFFAEPLDSRRVSGMLVALAGVAVLVVAAGDGFTASRASGILVLLGAPVSWGVYTVVAKDLAHRYDPVRLGVFGSSIAAVAVLPLAVADRRAFGALGAGDWGWLLFLGAVGGGLAVVLYGWALRRWTAAGLASFLFVVPAAGFLWAWSLLGEVPGPWMIAGGLLVALGLVLVWSSRPVRSWLSLPGPPSRFGRRASSA
ncbi:MAG: DMT family transporter [Acidimicrobiia bacterium]|nr:DMT family transporter [Acidimicrobiia bacterium]